MEKTVIHFAPGPSKIPNEVLLKVQEDFLNYQNTGISITEISHRSEDFAKIIDDAEERLRDAMCIPNDYTVLFLQGGGYGQMAAIPLNLIGLSENQEADYLVTGVWSHKAALEAEKYGKVNRVTPKLDAYTGIPDPSTWTLSPTASYVYYCANETINGIEFNFIPETNNVPLVCDMSSNILTRSFDVSKFGLILAGAQKNIGPAGVTIVIVRNDLLNRSLSICPSIWDYSVQKKNKSLLNTPPVFSIYVVGLVLKWLQEQGGVSEMENRSNDKAQLIYNEIAVSDGFYQCSIDKACRSRMNIPFRILNDVTLEKQFIQEAESDGMTSLAGHRSVGGIRVSLYNAISVDDTKKLAHFMKDFRLKHASKIH